MPDFTKDVEEFTTNDLLDAIYGQIQSITEKGKPDNVIFHYFLPPIPFGPELAMFMKLGRAPQMLDNDDGQGGTVYTANDMRRSAINFAVISDYVPTIGSDPIIANERDTTVDLNSLISSGKRVSAIYDAVLDNCRVIDNSLSDSDRERLEKLRSLLYEQPAAVTAPAEPEAGDDEIDALLADDSGDVDLDALLGENGADTEDFVENPDELLPPTRLMQLYQALQNNHDQVELAVLEQISEISPNDPNGGRKVRALHRKLESARRRWETQGKKRQVEAIMAKIAVLSRGGMPEYLDALRNRFDANEIVASLFTDDTGVSLVTEDAHYTALRPNGILDAPALMRVTLSSQNSKSFKKTSRSQSSGGFRLPIHSLLASAGGSKSSERLERSFFTEGFEISFEIVQGIIDRPWLDIAFLESGAYTTVDPDTKQPLSAVNEITTLSDGNLPPKAGVLPAIPTTIYFARDIVVTSRAFATMSDEERRSFSGRAGVSFLGFGASGKHSRSMTEATWASSQSSGELRLDGQFVIAVASRFLGKAPNPDFASHPEPTDWV